MDDKLKNLYYLEHQEIFQNVDYWLKAKEYVKYLNKTGPINPNNLDNISLANLRRFQSFILNLQKMNLLNDPDNQKKLTIRK